jgi:AcrR family transcriptional regulator
VARQTFYNHFESKESLFAEAVKGCFLDVIVHLDEQPANLRESLKNFARTYHVRALSAEGIASYRTACSQALHFPELVRDMYNNGFGEMMARLADFLDKAMKRGELRQTDALFAADLLAAMVLGQERSRRLFGIAVDESGSGASRVEYVVDGFLRMFAPETAQ